MSNDPRDGRAVTDPYDANSANDTSCSAAASNHCEA